MIHFRLSEAEHEKFGPYFPHLVDKFIDAIAKDVKEKSNDDIDYNRGYQQQTMEYANSALKQYNCANNKTVKLILVSIPTSCVHITFKYTSFILSLLMQIFSPGKYIRRTMN